MRSRRTVLAQLLILLSAARLCATQVEFYATVSSSANTGMITMTTDLFFNQLQSLDGYTVIDKRDIRYSEENAPTASIAFYAEIQENDEGAWVCTLNAIKADEQKNVSETKTYASYYKILLDAKSSLENVLTNITGAAQQRGPALSSDTAAPPSGGIDRIAGTWAGEQNIDRVVILRGGKGFVIFKNGASMNISVSISGTSVTIKQTGRSNASFFPDLPREVALKNATQAAPIEWALTLTDSSTLTGSKTTLVSDESSPTGTALGTLPVEWKKK